MAFQISTAEPARPNAADSVRAYKLNEVVTLDGRLNETIWNNKPINTFYQRDPDEGSLSTETTQVWVAYNESSLYIAAKLYDENPDLLDKSIVRRDNYIDSDWFFFYVDPYRDKTTGYFFGVNPGGSLCDGTFYNDSFNDHSWDGIWEVESSIDSDGWSVEMKIPFSQLRFAKADEMRWGVNFHRQIKRKNEFDFYVTVPKSEKGFVSHFAELEGLNGIDPPQRFEVIPYLVQRAQYLQHDQGDPFYTGNQYNTSIGLDIKLGLGSNLNLDIALNPDFGQAEVDPAVMNLSAFETFFQEKRSFFIEGANIFNFARGGATNYWGFGLPNPRLFYSRRIGRSPRGDVSDNDFEDRPKETRILGAAKLTGKIDNSISIGALSALTERTYSTLSLNNNKFEEEIEPLTHYAVFRTQKEFNGGKQAIGAMFTGVNRDLRNNGLKELLSDQAYTFGIDGWTFLDDDDTYVFTATAVGSYTHGSKKYITSLQESPTRYMQRPDATYARLDSNLTSLSGWFSKISLNKEKGNFYLNAALGASSPGFDFNDLGWQFITDRISGHLVLGYSWLEPGKVFRNAYVNLAYWRNQDFEGNLINNGIFSLNNFQFANYWNLHFRAGINFDRFSRETTRGGPLVIQPTNIFLFFEGRSDSRDPLIISPSFFYWLDKSGKNTYRASIDFEWRPDPQLSFNIAPGYEYNFDNKQWVDNFDDPYAVDTYNKRYVFGDLLQHTISTDIRLNWTFTPELSLQLYIQPFITIGKYSNFKELAQPRTDEYNNFGENGSTISLNENDDEYIIDPDGDGPADTFVIGNPNFNYKSLLGNLVLRWEVMPGSIFYFVWTHQKTNEDNPGIFNMGRDLGNLFQTPADNVFLVKFSYWFDI